MTSTLEGAATAVAAATLAYSAGSIAKGLGAQAGYVGLLAGMARPGHAATLPTTLPTDTTSLNLDNNEYSGTVPTQFGLLTNMVGSVYLNNNELTGALPTQLGLWTGMTRNMVGDCEGEGFKLPQANSNTRKSNSHPLMAVTPSVFDVRQCVPFL